jgi:hypothetical protein
MGCRAVVADAQLKRTARHASHRWIGARIPAALEFAQTPWTHCGTNVLPGRHGRQGDRLLLAARLIHMGVWHDPSQPRLEEPGALSHCDRMALEIPTGRLRGHGVAYSLDTGPLMGVFPMAAPALSRQEDGHSQTMA